MELYTVKTNQVYGRYLVAARNLKAGEMILQESPAVVGSQIDAAHICFRCSDNLRTNLQVCKRCGLATLCSGDCKGAGHNDAECEALGRIGLKTKDVVNCPQIIMPLRCLMLRECDKGLWDEFMKLEPHIEARKGTSIWRTYETTVETVMKQLGLVNEEDTEKMIIQTICGILDVNTFELRPPNSKNMVVNCRDCLRGLYLKASLMAHDCVGNTHLSIDDDLTMTVHSRVPIAEGEAIFFNYGSCLKGTYDRRLHLTTGKYFDCNCVRCSDPTELGTHMSSVRCTKCRSGLVIPSDPLNATFSTPWTCQSCGNEFRGQMIQSTLNAVQEKVSHLDLTSLGTAEQLLKMLLTSLPESHHLILELKQNVIPMYERNIFNDWALGRKITMCDDVLKIVRVVEPGISRLQGIALYQLHSAKVNLANKKYYEKKTSIDRYVQVLQEAEMDLKESMKHLVYEPKNSPEGRLLQNAFNDLKILRGMITQLQAKSNVGRLPKKDDLFLNVKTTKNKRSMK